MSAVEMKKELEGAPPYDGKGSNMGLPSVVDHGVCFQVYQTCTQLRAMLTIPTNIEIAKGSKASKAMRRTFPSLLWL